MTTDVLVTMAFAAVTPLLVALVAKALLTLAGLRPAWIAAWLGGALSGALAGLILGNWPWLAGSAVSAAIALLIRWWRKDGRRPLALAGAKSRARIAALVDRAREAARPSPVRRPAIGGAR